MKRALFVALGLLSLAVACGSGKRGFVEPPGGFLDAGTDGAVPTCGGLRCSRDLHSIVDDCTLAVVEQCAPELGCAKSACVSACDSAAASQGSIGCSFYTVPPDTAPSSEGSCFAAFVANTWNTPVSVEAEIGSAALDISRSMYRAIAGGETLRYERIDGPLPVGELGILFLAEDEPGPDATFRIGCPSGVEVAWRGSLATKHATSRYEAFHLKTSVPVSAYSLFPYGGAKSYAPAATLLLPTSSWHTNYLLIDGWKRSAGLPFVQIVAQEDDTEVRIRPQVDVLDGVGVSGAPRGSVARWTLNRGEVLELMQSETLAGSPIEASHPIALFGGQQCAFIPDVLACDSLHQQIPPVNQWASQYSAVPYESRRTGLAGAAPAPENVYWRLAGASDGTVLSYEPAAPPGAPSTLARGEIVTLQSEFPFVVKSQDVSHPFYLAVHMSGSTVYRTLGDPDFVNIVPDEQFLDRYVFFLDHTYGTSNLTIVRRRDVNGFHDVTLDCAGPVTGWQPLGSEGTTEYAWVNMTRNSAPVKTPIGECGYGRHEASSDGAFGLYVWGLDTDASYGFPAGAGSRPTTPVSIPVR